MIPGRNGNDRRIIRVSKGNVRQSHLYLNGIVDFFPADSLGPPCARAGTGKMLCLEVAGLPDPVHTDLPTDAKTGKPRGFFRKRAWVREFFRIHGVRPGDSVTIERKDRYSFAVRPERRKLQYTAAEFFAGIGLVRLGLEQQGWRVVFANDIDPDKAQMYRHNWPKCDHLFVGDIHEVRVSDVPNCDLITASFPCNDLSVAGRCDGLNGKESSAFWGLIRIIRELRRRRPALILLENVLGFLSSHRGRDFEQALIALNRLGYHIDAFVLNARHWTPQSRARLFVVAKRSAVRRPKSFALESDVRPSALVGFIASHQNIKWDIVDLPSPPKSGVRLADILENLPKSDPHWWDSRRADYFMNQLSDRHKVQAERMIAGRAYSYATAFRRVRHGRSMAELRTDGLAGCLRTPRGGSGRQILFKAGREKYQVRLLTGRECARLQGVPDSYKIDVGLNQALFGFGDAVCVPAIEWIVKHVLNRELAECAGASGREFQGKRRLPAASDPSGSYGEIR